MEDFIDHPSREGAKVRTMEILASPAKLFTAIRETFDVSNDTLEANRDLRALR
jgi:hypothetical protein